MQLHLVEVARIQHLNSNVVELWVRPVKPKVFRFKPGQFVFFDIGGAWKAYSIASVPEQKELIRFLIKLEPNGRGSAFIRNLKPGNRFEFSGPEGEFVVRSKTKPLYCIAAGIGIAPFLSIIPSQLARMQSTVTLLYGVSRAGDLVCKNEFFSLVKKNRKFKFIPVIGHLPEYIHQNVEMEKGAVCFVCGKSEAVSAIENSILAKRGSAVSVVTEVFLQ